MEVSEQGGGVHISGNVEYQACRGILDQLYGSDGRCWEASYQGVAVVQAGQDHWLDEKLSRVGSEERTDSPNVIQEEPVCSGHR